MNSILDHINQESLKSYGEICDNCAMHDKFCRCESLAELQEKIEQRRIDLIAQNGNTGEHYEKDN